MSKKAIFEKNHKSTPLQKCKFLGQAVTGAYEGNRGGYKELQEVTRGYKGYKGLEGVGGEREIWKRICQKST